MWLNSRRSCRQPGKFSSVQTHTATFCEYTILIPKARRDFTESGWSTDERLAVAIGFHEPGTDGFHSVPDFSDKDGDARWNASLPGSWCLRVRIFGGRDSLSRSPTPI